MPKTKTNSGAKKKFKVTATGKLLRRHAMQSHILEKKSQKRKRSFRSAQALDKSNVKQALKMLGRK